MFDLIVEINSLENSSKSQYVDDTRQAAGKEQTPDEPEIEATDPQVERASYDDEVEVTFTPTASKN